MLEDVQVRLSEHAHTGDAQLLIRVRLEDRRDIRAAARMLGLSQSQFVRNVIIQAARTVIAEAKSLGAA
jgi:uncharacterized protein (DUF1778 family)